MKPELLALFYAGPDQIIPLQTTLAAALAFLLLFWSKMRALLARAWDHIQAKHAPAMVKHGKGSDRVENGRQ